MNYRSVLDNTILIGVRAALILIVLAAAQTLHAYKAEDCVTCHESGSIKSRRHISVEDLATSAHGADFSCLDCHTGIEDEGHTDMSGSGAVNCRQCHDQVNRHGFSGDSENLPQCFHCHTKHRILTKEDTASSVHPDNLVNTCRMCHPTPCGLTSAFSWLPSLKVASHSKQDFSQSYSENNCIGCHQGKAAHGEDNPLSDHLCYVCHVPLSAHPLLAGYIHVNAGTKNQWASFAAGIIYASALALLVWGGFQYYITRRSRSTDIEES